VWEGGGRERVQVIQDFARRVEDLGFDSIFMTDHVIAAKHFYDVSWLDSLTSLTYVAAVTKRVRLGTSILVLPLRHPVILAKQIATLEYLSSRRYIIGAGVGWYGPEFEATGTHKRERGRRSDEILDIVRGLLTQESFTYDGRYYQCPPTRRRAERAPRLAPSHSAATTAQASWRSTSRGDATTVRETSRSPRSTTRSTGSPRFGESGSRTGTSPG